jgi:hypothetical protein
MKIQIYKTGILVFLLLCTQIAVHSKNCNEKSYDNPFDEINKKFESLPNNSSPFDDAIMYYDEEFSRESYTEFTFYEDSNNSVQQASEFSASINKEPVEFISGCMLLYGLFCFIRIRKKKNNRIN